MTSIWIFVSMFLADSHKTPRRMMRAFYAVASSFFMALHLINPENMRGWDNWLAMDTFFYYFDSACVASWWAIVAEQVLEAARSKHASPVPLKAAPFVFKHLVFTAFLICVLTVLHRLAPTGQGFLHAMPVQLTFVLSRTQQLRTRAFDIRATMQRVQTRDAKAAKAAAAKAAAAKKAADKAKNVVEKAADKVASKVAAKVAAAPANHPKKDAAMAGVTDIIRLSYFVAFTGGLLYVVLLVLVLAI
jgi:hypothetical protein